MDGGIPAGSANGVRTLIRLLRHDQPLTAGQREQLRHTMRGLRLAADRVEEALDGNSAVQSLQALQLAADAGQVAAGLAAAIAR
jgi:hypothetical protein